MWRSIRSNQAIEINVIALIVATIVAASCSGKPPDQQRPESAAASSDSSNGSTGSTSQSSPDSAFTTPPPPPPPPPPPAPRESPSDFGGQVGAPPRTPPHGSAERAAIIDAVRRDVGNSTEYRVDFLRATPRWAYFSGTEVAPLEGKELQETDLSVQALLERRAGGDPGWDVVERWTLPSEEQSPRKRFLEQLRLRIDHYAIPKALFPRDLFQ